MPPTVEAVDARALIQKMDRQAGLMERLIEAILHGPTNRGINQGRAFHLDNHLGSPAIKNDEASKFWAQAIPGVGTTAVLAYRPETRERIIWLGVTGSLVTQLSMGTHPGLNGSAAGALLADPRRFLYITLATTFQTLLIPLGRKGQVITPRNPLFVAQSASGIVNLTLGLAPLGD